MLLSIRPQLGLLGGVSLSLISHHSSSTCMEEIELKLSDNTNFKLDRKFNECDIKIQSLRISNKLLLRDIILRTQKFYAVEHCKGINCNY